MSDIELVIKIPEGLKKDFESEQWTALSCMEMKDALMKGVPLKKGHGRLIDADKLKAELECGIRAGNYEEGYEKYAHINDMDDCVDAVVYADTIIEADKAESENVPDKNSRKIYRCACGYGWDKTKAVRHHFCPNCGAKVAEGSGK